MSLVLMKRQKYTTEKYKGENNLDCRYYSRVYKIIPKIQEPTLY